MPSHADGEAPWERVCALSLEGVVAKKRPGIICPGRRGCEAAEHSPQAARRRGGWHLKHAGRLLTVACRESHGDGDAALRSMRNTDAALG
jgi:hypothetical protein